MVEFSLLVIKLTSSQKKKSHKTSKLSIGNGYCTKNSILQSKNLFYLLYQLTLQYTIC